jgi:hypothetical protein
MTTPSLSLDFPRVASHVRLYGQLATLIDENLPLAESAPDVGNVFVLGKGPHQPGDKWKFFHSFYCGAKRRTFWTPLMAAGHIGALTGRASSGQGHAALSGPGHGGSKLTGRKLSAAHRKAIKEGIAKRKARKHGAGKAKES